MDEKVREFLESIEKPSEEQTRDANPLVMEYTHFSKKKYLRYDGGKLYGGWARSFGGACREPFGNWYLQKESIIEIREIGKCDDGDTIVMCTHY